MIAANLARHSKPRIFIPLLVLLITLVAPAPFTARYLQRERLKNIRNRALVDAIRAYDTPRVVSLLESGADPNSPAKPAEMPTLWRIIGNVIVGQRPSRGPTALHVAAEPLLVDPDAHEDLYTPRPEQLKIMEALLRHGANVNDRDQHDSTALNYAAGWIDDREIDLLISYGADVNNSNATGETPLMQAAADDNEAGVKTLLKHHAEVNKQSKSGGTALMYAAMGSDNSLGIVKDLIDHHADIRLKDEHGYSALTFAMHPGAREIVRVLRAAGTK